MIHILDVLVQCSEAGSDDCTNSNAGNIALLEVTYSSCCSMVKAEDRYYLDQDQNCRRCGKSELSIDFLACSFDRSCEPCTKAAACIATP